MEKRPHVLRIEVEPRCRGSKQTRHVAVSNEHALWPTRRAGGVDHVSEIIRSAAAWRRQVPLGDLWPRLIQTKHLHTSRRRPFQKLLLGEQYWSSAVGEH